MGVGARSLNLTPESLGEAKLPDIPSVASSIGIDARSWGIVLPGGGTRRGRIANEGMTFDETHQKAVRTRRKRVTETRNGRKKTITPLSVLFCS